MGHKLNILLCDCRQGDPVMTPVQLDFPKDAPVTVGQALMQLEIASSAKDPRIARKGCFGVFGKRKDWDSPIYDGDRLELYSELLIDPMEARRKKANKNLDNRLQAKAAGRKGRFLSKPS
jgi:putative ubiquitin-RnfH superfamily antitoxin RatB of RatAB toxin-antitoxin module